MLGEEGDPFLPELLQRAADTLVERPQGTNVPSVRNRVVHADVWWRMAPQHARSREGEDGGGRAITYEKETGRRL